MIDPGMQSSEKQKLHLSYHFLGTITTARSISTALYIHDYCSNHMFRTTLVTKYATNTVLTADFKITFQSKQTILVLKV